MPLLAIGCGASAPAYDSDGDGLPDDWERNGVDVDGDGVVDLDLPGLGADPRHKDIFVEMDWMEVPGPGGHSDAWLPGALERVQDAFLAAPVDNPDGQPGIVLHVDAGPDSLLDPRSGARWGDRSGANAIDDEADLTTDRETALRATHLAAARHGVFRYAIAGHSLAPIPNPLCAGEQLLVNGLAAGGELIVTQAAQTGALVELGGFRPYDELQEASLFMHELGHTLGLDHGGRDAVNRKPNYLSVMNYSFTYRGLRIAGGYGHLDYSRRTGPLLDEAALDEARGLADTGDGDVRGTIFFCPGATTLCEADVAALAQRMVEVEDSRQPIDWNCNGAIDAAPVTANVNIETPGERLTTQDDWHALDFAAAGWIGPGAP